MTEPVLVDMFATGFQRTTIHRLGDGTFVWTRGAGPDRPTPLTAPSAQARSHLASLPRPDLLTLSLPTVADIGLRYAVPGSITAAKVLWSEPSPASSERLAGAFRSVGKVLGLLHSHPAPPGSATGGPIGPARLAAWMDSGRGPRAAARMHALLRDSVGATRWAAVRDWCHDLGRPGPDATLLHGAPSTGSLVLPADPAPHSTDEEGHPAGGAPRPIGGAMLTGEELALGPSGFDLGWMLGELLELRMTAVHRLVPRPILSELPAALLAGYGVPVDPVVTGRAATLRMLTHAHDFAAYVGWHPELELYARTAARYIDTDGLAALDGGV
ncbi:hypothetical protein [Streptomyces sp. NBC_01205]|uniref:hypothetical protein n=1 Tax=Streptomyces sp. NBC_01205 TaxID=2903771 RepID=UPI002E0D5244|nr:hypothetical protein OG573_41655 [Streptomyces sp. NBC_01205]